MGQPLVILGNRGVKRVACALLLLLTYFQGPAAGHQASTTYLKVDFGADGIVDVRVKGATGDLYEVAAAGPEHVVARVRVSAAGAACPPGEATVDIDGAFAEVRWKAACPPHAQPVALDYDLYFDLDPAHVALAELRAGDRVVSHEFRAASRHFEWSTADSSFVTFVRHGLDHIFTGYDHLAFVLGLLLVAPLLGVRGGARHMLGVVTAFTVAHSITLILAGLDLVRAPSSLVEAAIAASIAYIGVENLFRRGGRRWPLAFAFGLVHGLGFASMLRPLLPTDGIVWPLVAFNLGVELGQLGVVAVVFPVLLFLRHTAGARYGRLVFVGSLAIAGAGAYWFIERV
jgi:HupE / UreJ protein